VEMLSHWVGERKGAPAPLWGLDGVTVAHRQAKQGANKRYAKHTDCRGDRTGGRIGEGHRGMLAPGRSGGFPNREPATRRDTAAQEFTGTKKGHNTHWVQTQAGKDGVVGRG
jgi:hypothetical protein